jgi:serine/threonine-protein kinase
VQQVEDFSADVLPGFVIRTEPAAGQQVPAEATITLVVSKGPEPVRIPNLVGLTQAEANASLNALGLFLVVDTETVEVSIASGNIGKIAEQAPPAGQTVEVGAQVTVKLGVIRTVEVPDVMCMTEEDAEEAAIEAGMSFVVIDETPASNPSDEGKIESQGPSAGTMVDEGTVLEVTVYGPAPPPPTSTTSSTSFPEPACP